MNHTRLHPRMPFLIRTIPNPKPALATTRRHMGRLRQLYILRMKLLRRVTRASIAGLRAKHMRNMQVFETNADAGQDGFVGWCTAAHDTACHLDHVPHCCSVVIDFQVGLVIGQEQTDGQYVP
jgi:hypothetical protein